MIRGAARSVLILFVIGTFVSAQQVRAANVFTEDKSVDLAGMTLQAPDFSPGEPGARFYASADTIETYEIEIEGKKSGNIYKEIAMVAIIAAFATYMVVTVFFPGGEDEEEDNGGGKDLPDFTAVPLLSW